MTTGGDIRGGVWGRESEVRIKYSGKTDEIVNTGKNMCRQVTTVEDRVRTD